jgi:vitamin B12 transporter
MKTYLSALAVFFYLNTYLAFAENLDGTSNSDKETLTTLNIFPSSFVTATRIPTNIDKLGRPADARSEIELEQRQNRTLSESLQTVSGLRLNNIGGPGAPGAMPIEIRGFRSGGTQLMVNSLTLSDPSAISGTFDNFFPSISTNELRSIEVLKGSTGVLYGSDGQAGAINLILKTPERGTVFNALLEGGSYGTYRENAAVGYGSEQFGFRSSVSRTDSNGLDAHGNFENTVVTSLAKVTSENESLSFNPLLYLVSSKLDLDSNPTVGTNGELIPAQDTELNNSKLFGYLLGGTFELAPNETNATKLSVYYVRSERDFFFDFDGFESISNYQGDSFNVDLQTIFDLPTINSKLSLGLESEHQKSSSNASGLEDISARDQFAGFIYNQASFLDEQLQIAGGARLTYITDISKTVPTLEGSIQAAIPDTIFKLHSSIAQGFRAPTLFESKGVLSDFDTGETIRVGNSQLEEEQALSWDIGIRANSNNDLFSADITFFQIHSKETIIFDFGNYTHLNGGSGNTQGLESSILLRPCEYLYFRAAYTYLDEADVQNGGRRQRTPRNWYAISAVATHGNFIFSPELRFRDSQRLEFFGESERLNEAGVTLLDATASYSISKQVQIFIRAENIFDVNYTEAGFNMPNASAYAGLKISI